MSHIGGATESEERPLAPRPTHGLPRAALLSPRIFQVEQERIFSRYWLSATGADRLKEAGACCVVDWPGRPLIIARGQDGRLRGFDNVCRHRGCRIVAPPMERHAGAFRCPYHGWTYREDGRLAAAPNSEGQIDAHRDELGLKSVAVDVAGEQVFIRFAADGVTLQDWLHPLLSIAAPWFQTPLFCAHRIEYDIQANWKLVFQNFNECYHCRFVHPGLNALTRFDTVSNDLVEGPILGGPMVLSEGFDSITTTGQHCGLPFASLDRQQIRRVFYFTVFPNLFVSPHPDYVMTHRLIPLTTSRTRIECEFWFDDSLRQEGGWDASTAVEFWDQVNREDWYVCEQTQAGIESLSYEPGPYSLSESMVIEFDRYYRSVMRGVEFVE